MNPTLLANVTLKSITDRIRVVSASLGSVFVPWTWAIGTAWILDWLLQLLQKELDSTTAWTLANTIEGKKRSLTTVVNDIIKNEADKNKSQWIINSSNTNLVKQM